MEFREIFLKQKESIHKRMVDILGMIRPALMDWRPEKDALSVAEMLQHLWVSEEGVRRVALDGDFSYYETRIPKGLRSTLGAPMGLQDNLSNIARVHEQTMAAVGSCPAQIFELERRRPDLGYHRKVWLILLGINEHEVHHRAQLGTYLRMLGTPIPDAARAYVPSPR